MTPTATLLQRGPEFEAAVLEANVEDAAETMALMDDFINGVLRRVNKLIKDGLPPLGSTVAGYERISDDREGLKLGVTRQRDDNQSLAAADGTAIPEQAEFRDNDRGASTRSKKTRPYFELLLAYILTGQVRVVYAYSTSRLTRRPLEFEILIRVAEATGVRYVTKASGSDDLSTSQGRMVARIKAAVDANEAEQTAERVARAALDAAQKGKPVGGIRPFGYLPDKVNPNPYEAELIRRAANDLIYNSVSLRHIARQWQDLGVETVTTEYARKRVEKAAANGETIEQDIPAPWHPNVIRNILRNPRLAGWRTHRGVIAKDAHGHDVRGQWVPILDQDTFDRLQAVICKPPSKRQRGKRGSRVYMLSGILMCGICRGRLYGARVDRPGAGPHRYVCLGSVDNKHVLGVGGKSMDAYIGEAVLRAMEEEDVEAGPVSFTGDERIEELRGLVEETEAAYYAGQMKLEAYLRITGKAEEELATLEEDKKKFTRLVSGPPVEQISREAWLDLTPGQQRARVESVIDTILIKPTDSRGPKLDPDRVDIIWKRRRP